MKKRSVIRALNIATNEVVLYAPTHRFGVDPKYLFSPPNFTVEDAFDEHFYLRDAIVGSTVFIEWPLDRFCSVDGTENRVVVGGTVWRKAEVLEHIDAPAGLE